MNALMMKIAARNMLGLNLNHEDKPDDDDLRRESERRKSPLMRALKSYGGKSIFGGPGILHAHVQNLGAKERTRHMSDKEVDAAHRKAEAKRRS